MSDNPQDWPIVDPADWKHGEEVFCTLEWRSRVNYPPFLSVYLPLANISLPPDHPGLTLRRKPALPAPVTADELAEALRKLAGRHRYDEDKVCARELLELYDAQKGAGS